MFHANMKTGLVVRWLISYHVIKNELYQNFQVQEIET